MEHIRGKNKKNIIILYFIICSIGLYIMLDISSARSTLFFVQRQAIYFLVASIVMFICSKLNLIKYRRFVPYILFFTMGLLVMVLVKGAVVKGAQRSIGLGPINIQPSVLARVVIVLYTAHILDKKKDLIARSKPSKFFPDFLGLIILILVNFVLIFLERHFSTLVLLSCSIMCLFWLSGIRKLTLFLIIAVALAGGVMVINKGEKYRGGRIEIYKKYSLLHKYLNLKKPEKTDDDLQIRESLTALSSGKLRGTGTDGGRGKHYHLPEARTDYIFTIIGEEFGFLGAAFIMLLYVALFFSAMRGSWRVSNGFLRLAGCGLAINLFLNVLINIGVAMSALPSTGVTLPFISYGGSSYLVNAIGVGLIANIVGEKE